MLKLKDLENRVYEGRTCIGFDYTVTNEQKERLFEARWRRSKDDIGEWHMQIILDRTRDADSQVYNFGYIMPRPGLPLELIAATGLKYMQLYLKEEIQKKSEYDFALGEILKDM